MSEFGQYLRTVRKERGLTQRALAARVGVDHTYISKIEAGAFPPPSVRTLRRMAQALQTDEGAVLHHAGQGTMLAEQTVRDAIHALIARKERRMVQLVTERESVQKDEMPAQYANLTMGITRLDHSILTLIELAHNLHLCDCPDEAYQTPEGKEDERHD